MRDRIRSWHRRKWRDRSRVEKVGVQSRLIWTASTWFLFVSWDLMFVLEGLGRGPLPLALAAALLVAGVAQCVQGNRVHRLAVDHYLGRAAAPRGGLVTAGVLCAVSVALLAGLRAAHGIKDPLVMFVLLFTLLPFGMAYCLLLPTRAFLLRFPALCMPLVVLFALAGMAGPQLAGLAFVTVISGLYVLLVSRCGAWQLSVLGEADRARESEARLAVAEERLRFGRDLHDVLGRNLSVIALKSELAVQLAQRGRPEAVAQMVEVQRIAQESQREVREVVRGYREADLGVELDGARGVLEAAGIACTVRGTADPLPAEVQSALGWVVREATTNVLRHGDARNCSVTVTATEDAAGLVVENDGAPDRPAGAPGSGLAGLRERLSVLEGTLTAGPVTGGRFRLTARVPLADGPGTEEQAPAAAGRRREVRA
ncbi:MULTISPECIES: sensor histidine kinase [unclassified Streptomyces]|uniref:sensor histidine kinase n=1 Tax=unclassified Streptomyces TaxID=2593676 RepID=UPI003814161A